MGDGVVDAPFTVMTAVLKTTKQSRELACLGSDFGKTLNSRACFAFGKAHRPTTHEHWNVQRGPKIISKQSVLSLFFT